MSGLRPIVRRNGAPQAASGYRGVDAISSARSPEDIINAVVECLTAHGLRSSWGELRGDEIVMLATGVPDSDALRIEELLGIPFRAMRFPVATYASFASVVHQRSSMVEDAFPNRFVSMFRHLTATQRAAARRYVGRGPLVVAPIVDGDTMLGILLAWGPTVVAQRRLVETLAGLAGMAWHWLDDESAALAPAVHEAVALDSTELASALRAMIAPGGIRSALQPVVRLGDRTVVGYEALCRFTPREGIRNPDELFSVAASTNLKHEVDAACLVAAFASAWQAAPATLFVNVAVETLVEGRRPGEDLSRFAEIAGIDPGEVVLEVSERTPISNLARLRRVVADLRNRGFRIAIDDAGAGHASMLVIAEVQPEFIKIDRLLIHGLDVNDARRALVVSLLAFAARINARVIAEGVETDEELQALLNLGVEFGQGWRLGRPVMVAPPVDAGGVVTITADWFGKQSVSTLRNTTGGPLVDQVARETTAPVSARRGHVALPRALISVTTALQSEHDPARILEVMAEHLQTVLAVDGVYGYAADETQTRFVPIYATGKDDAARLAYSYSMELGVNGLASKLGLPQSVPDVLTHPASIRIPGTPAETPESCLAIPLIVGDRRLGVLDVTRVGIGRFSDSDLDAAVLFGQAAAAAWRIAELYGELGDRATRDPLTGLRNSRWLRDVGEDALAESVRNRRPMAILLLDLDNFRQINDAGGHSAGDLVLRRVAAALRGSIRSGDVAIRLGSEEFLLLLSDADAVGAERIAVAFRARLAAVPLPRSCLPRAKLTVSVGIAVQPRNGTRLDELVRAADRAMHKAKRAGGDRHQLSTEESGSPRSGRATTKLRGVA